jgi:hypothetical protein
MAELLRYKLAETSAPGNMPEVVFALSITVLKVEVLE